MGGAGSYVCAFACFHSRDRILAKSLLSFRPDLLRFLRFLVVQKVLKFIVQWLFEDF